MHCDLLFYIGGLICFAVSCFIGGINVRIKCIYLASSVCIFCHYVHSICCFWKKPKQLGVT